MRIRLLETENDKLMSAAIYEKGRSESAKRLELEVQRLKELVEHFRFEAQSPEGTLPAHVAPPSKVHSRQGGAQRGRGGVDAEDGPEGGARQAAGPRRAADSAVARSVLRGAHATEGRLPASTSAHNST